MAMNAVNVGSSILHRNDVNTEKNRLSRTFAREKHTKVEKIDVTLTSSRYDLHDSLIPFSSTGN